MKQRLWYSLYTLLELGSSYRFTKTSTIELAKALNVSQQTASRHLIELEKMGLIMRYASFRGVDVKITEKGIEELRRIYLRLKKFLGPIPNRINIEGTVSSGLGEGAYYVSQRGYMRQFERKLGFKPYPGTLNVKLNGLEIIKKNELETYPPIVVEGFKYRKKLFGEVRCYPTTINNDVLGAVIIINRTHHNHSIMEVIASENLRAKLKLKDGDRVTLNFSPGKSRLKIVND